MVPVNLFKVIPSLRKCPICGNLLSLIMTFSWSSCSPQYFSQYVSLVAAAGRIDGDQWTSWIMCYPTASTIGYLVSFTINITKKSIPEGWKNWVRRVLKITFSINPLISFPNVLLCYTKGEWGKYSPPCLYPYICG